MFHQDWIMRQIQMIAHFIAKLLWDKDIIEYRVEDEDDLTETDMLYNELDKLLAGLKICEAENLLFERLDKDNERYLELAVNFYLELNKLTDEDLEGADFSREEVYSGLREVIGIFGLPEVFL